MEGFSNRCLLIFPRIENYENKLYSYQQLVTATALKLITYLKTQSIETECFSTDEVATACLDNEVTWRNPCTPEDSRFVSVNCGLNLVGKGKDLDRYFDVARKKYKVKRGMSTEDRFKVAMQREKLVAGLYIKDTKLVATYYSKSTAYYKIVSMPNDRRLLFYINPSNFTLTCMLSGNPIDASFIIPELPVRNPIYEWRV